MLEKHEGGDVVSTKEANGLHCMCSFVERFPKITAGLRDEGPIMLIASSAIHGVAQWDAAQIGAVDDKILLAILVEVVRARESFFGEASDIARFASVCGLRDEVLQGWW